MQVAHGNRFLEHIPSSGSTSQDRRVAHRSLHLPAPNRGLRSVSVRRGQTPPHLPGSRCAPQTVEGVSGVRFATWAPNAERVSVVGDFNGWDGRTHAMRSRVGVGYRNSSSRVWGSTASTSTRFVTASRAQFCSRPTPTGSALNCARSTASIVVGTGRFCLAGREVAGSAQPMGMAA